MSKRKSTRVLYLLIMVAVTGGIVFLFVSTAFPFHPDKSSSVAGDEILTHTHWQQMGGFQAFTPDHERIGCWGTALAQLVYYYRLKPAGRVGYTSSRGYRVEEDLSSFAFDFSSFTPGIDSSTAPRSREQLAKYCYYAALVVRKDFGTGKNMDLLPSPATIEAHYPVSVSRYISWKNLLPYTNGKLEKIIYGELNEKRPVYLHFSNFRDIGHSVLVDGYYYDQGAFKVHLNQGQGGPGDGWYDFYKGFLKPDDNALRVVYTFRLTSQRRSSIPGLPQSPR